MTIINSNVQLRMYVFINSFDPINVEIFGEPIVDLLVDRGLESNESCMMTFEKLCIYLQYKHIEDGNIEENIL